MARRIVITSGKGGVGKTTICANLGTMLAMLSNRVCLIDADIGLNNLDVVTNIENKVVYDVLDIVKGKCRASQALVKDINYPNLYILPSIKGGYKDITTENFNKIILSLDGLFDYILIDCPAGVDKGFHRAVNSATEALVVSTPNISSIRDADKTLSTLATYKLDRIGLIINMIRGDLVVSGDMLSAQDISKLLRITPVGIIPSDDEVILSNMVTVSYKTASTKAFISLAENVMGKSNKLYDYMVNYRGVVGKVRSKLKRIL